MKFTSEQKNLVFAVNQNLYPASVLASRYHVAFNTVKNLVIKYESFTKCNTEVRTVNESNIDLSIQEKNQLIRDFNNDFNYSDLEKRYKLTGNATKLNAY